MLLTSPRKKSTQAETLAVGRRDEASARQNPEVQKEGRLDPKLIREYTHFASEIWRKAPELMKWGL
jgi:hypothetical protein